jgi:hypothetical protein
MKPLERIILALDKSMRRIDENGFLHVACSNISKAMVCPYNGSEIADIAQEAGVVVDPNKVYFLLRDPEELAAGASTFNGIPLTYVHEPLSSEDLATDPEKKEIVVGAIGTDAMFVKPYLQASLVVWDAAAIQRIQTREQVELSCAYRWVLDMTPGTYEGVAYDGVMRKLRGNHVALVVEGRAGPDVLVADAKPKTHKEQSPMKQKKLSPRAIAVRGALLGRIPLSLAADQKLKVSDLTPLVAHLTAKEFKTQKAKLAEDIKKAFAPRLAQDADLDDILSLLDNLEDGSGEADIEDAKPAVVPPPIAKDDDMTGDGNEAGQELLALLQAQNLPDEVMAQAAALLDKISPAAPAVDGFPPKKGAAVPNPNDTKALTVGKPAMDAAIQVAADATIARMQAVREAEDAVEPIIGRVRGQNTAEGVYKLALDHMKVDLTGLPSVAYGPLFQRLAQNMSDEPVDASFVAQDSKALDAYAKRFNPDRIRR